MKREQKFDAVLGWAISFANQSKTESFGDLATRLNRNGFRTSKGTLYTGGRGVARLVQAVYAYARNELSLGDVGAAPVAEAFTTQNGNYAYK